jgi:hypothetical protein
LLNPVVVIVLFLATWRLSSLFIDEIGFLHIFTIIRHIFGVRYVYYEKHDGEQIIEKRLTLKEAIELGMDSTGLDKIYTNHFAELFSCIWCMSVWVGTLNVILVALNPVFIIAMLILACSTATIFIGRLADEK